MGSSMELTLEQVQSGDSRYTHAKVFKILSYKPWELSSATCPYTDNYIYYVIFENFNPFFFWQKQISQTWLPSLMVLYHWP